MILKITFCGEGVKATRLLSEKGIKCLVTAIYTLSQVAISAEAGAHYVAPYVNRMEDAGIPIGTVADM